MDGQLCANGQQCARERFDSGHDSTGRCYGCCSSVTVIVHDVAFLIIKKRGVNVDIITKLYTVTGKKKLS